MTIGQRWVSRSARTLAVIAAALVLSRCEGCEEPSGPDDPGTIRGAVFSEGRRVPGVEIVLLEDSGGLGRRWTRTTGAQGVYEFLAVDFGLYRLTIAPSEGYELAPGQAGEQEISMCCGHEITVDWELRPEQGPGLWVISDSTFNEADWWILQISTRGGVQSAEQSSSEGNPPPYRLMRHFLPRTFETDSVGNPLPSAINVQHWFERAEGEYDPIEMGKVERIDLRMDRRVLSSSPSGGAVGHGFLLRQNNRIFWTDLGSFTSTSWETREVLGLTASDFTNSAGQHPDFSESGAPLMFGYLRSNSNTGQGADVEMRHGIDNWRVTIHR